MADTAITSSDIQVRYEQLYTFLMEYLWEFKVVQALANLEISIFKRFPDKDEMSRNLQTLKRDISLTYNELDDNDEPDFKDAFEKLEEAIDAYDNAGCELYSVQEVIDDPEDVEASEELDYRSNLDSESKKKPFRFGDIEKHSKAERELQDEAIDTLSNPFEPEENDAFM